VQQNCETLDGDYRSEVLMNWDAVAAIAESIGAVGVIATLVYLAAQVRGNTKAVRVATYDSFVAQFRDWNAPLRASPELTSQFVRQLEDIESLDEAARQHAVHVFYDFFKLAENLHYQYRMEMIDHSLWSGWANIFEQYFTAPGTSWYWEHRRAFFAPEFVEWVDSLQVAKPEQPIRSAQIAKSD
jgi:hypothetical protein